MESAQNNSENVFFKALNFLLWALFLLLVFSLAFKRPFFNVLQKDVPITDFIFLPTFFLLIISIILKQIKFRWNEAYWALLFYFLAMLISSFFSIDPKQSLIKMLGVSYLVGLAFLTINVIRSKKRLKFAFWAWLIGTFFAISISLLSVFLFYFDRDNSLLFYTLSHYGTLPPGNYPRVEGSFLNPNMLCNYLSISFLILLASLKLGWINKKFFIFLMTLLFIACLFTISPGFGGILLSIGIWFWLIFEKKNKLARFSLFGGIFFALIFFLSVIFTPIPTETSPFTVKFPIIEKEMHPTPRLLAWQTSIQTFIEYPIFGRGAGIEPANAVYKSPEGGNQRLTDSHQLWLNVAGQAGILGFLAICWICVFGLKKTLPFGFENEDSILRTGLGIAFLSAFIYQGLTGSFEDARHIWVLIGFIGVSGGSSSSRSSC